MPRAVQTLDSEEKMGESRETVDDDDDDDDETDTQSFATLTTNDLDENMHTHPTISRVVNSSQNSIIFRDCDDDDENSPLRVIIGGKVKKFKKDSRVWLHKSSARAAARKAGITAPHESKMSITEDYIGDSYASLEQISREKNSLAANDDKFNPQPSPLDEAADDSNSSLSIMGDSDADISYSEEEINPSETTEVACMRSSSFYQSENDNSPLRKDEPMETEDSHTESKTKFFPYLQDSLCRCNSHESGDETDETQGNSCLTDSNPSQGFFMDPSNKPTVQELSRRLAPAITFEEESLRENLLDSAYRRNLRRQVPEMRNPLPCRIQKRKNQKRKACSLNEEIPKWMRSWGCPYAKNKRQQSPMKEKEEYVHDLNRYLGLVAKEINGQAPCSSHTADCEVPQLHVLAAAALSKTDVKTDRAENQTDRPHSSKESVEEGPI